MNIDAHLSLSLHEVLLMSKPTYLLASFRFILIKQEVTTLKIYFHLLSSEFLLVSWVMLHGGHNGMQCHTLSGPVRCILLHDHVQPTALQRDCNAIM